VQRETLLPNHVAGFLGRALIALVALGSLWFLIRTPWGECFCLLGNLGARLVGADAWIRFTLGNPNPNVPSTWDTFVWMTDGGGVVRGRLTMGSLKSSYIPLCVFACLTFVAYTSGRKVAPHAVLAGCGAVLGYVAGSRVVAILYHVALVPELSSHAPGRLEQALVRLIFRAIVAPTGLEYVVPALIWFISVGVFPRERRASSRRNTTRNVNGRNKKRKPSDSSSVLGLPPSRPPP
jgi:hypothetical protein